MKLKLCGNYSFEDLFYTSNSKADYIGFVFAESKRKVSIMQVRKWLNKTKINPAVKIVGIFVNAPLEEIAHVTREVPIDVIQAHGNETVPYLLQIKGEIGLPIWKAIHHEEDSIKKMRIYEGIVDGYVIDARTKAQWGGTGTRFDWSHVPSYLEEAKRQNALCFIAGGINPENVDEILKYNPDGIDISSGIETSGRKDKEKIIRLEERLIEYEQSNT